MIGVEWLGPYIPPLLKTYFLHPEVLLAAPILVVILWLIILWPRKSIPDNVKSALRKRLAGTLVIFRTAVILFLLIALASPFFEREETLRGEPTLKVLVDNSSSMGVYDLSFVEGVVGQLKTQLDVEVVSAGESEYSALGQDILSRTKTGDTALIISDGRITQGAGWNDVIPVLQGNNVTVHVFDMQPARRDSYVTILSPTKTTIGADTPIGIVVGSAGPRSSVRVVVTVDGKTVLDKTTNEEVLTHTMTFTEGYHQVKAEIVPEGEDAFSENNVAYRVIKATAPPVLALVTSKPESPLARIANDLYDTTVTSSVPADLRGYHTVILDDIPANAVTNDQVDRLTDYVVDGNGLFVVGGTQSYDLGGYKNSPLETILPAYVGASDTAGGESAIVIVIDISASAGQQLPTGEQGVDVQKALALQAVRDMGADNQVGIVAFNHQSFVVSPLQYSPDKTELETKVKRLYASGGTLIEMGLMEAMEMLKASGGSKNIVLISDGVTRFPGKAMSAAFLASDQGIRIYTVGIGTTTDEQLMSDIARVTSGTYFSATNVNKLRILFGDPEDQNQEGGSRDFVILDSNHFITQRASVNAKLGGYNYIVPKSTAQLLAASNGGESLLVVWRIGLGRVASLGTDDGTQYAGQLYSSANSAVIVRTLNWLIGAPDRLQKRVIDVPDAFVGSAATVTVTSEIPPSIAGIDFVKIGERSYAGEFEPEEPGFHTLEEAVYAVNPSLEYYRTGNDPALDSVAEFTKGSKVTEEGIADLILKVKSSSRRTIITKDPYRWPFVLAAIVLFIIEIAVRRVLQSRLRRKMAEGAMRGKV